MRGDQTEVLVDSRALTAAGGLRSGSLLEREREVALFEQLLEQASKEAGSTVVLDGPPGIGKTRLLGTLADAAERCGFRVLRARGRQLEREMPFGVARQLFERALRRTPALDRACLLEGVAEVGARALGLAGGEGPADRFAAIHGLYWVCANLAERQPVLMLVDDVHWADDPSLEWLGYLAPRCGELCLLLAAGVRKGEPGAERAAAALEHEAAVRLSLGPLTRDGVRALVRVSFDESADEEFCAACEQLTGGNPLLLQELLAAARDDGFPADGEGAKRLASIASPAIGGSVLARLSGLGPDAIALAHAVAILGDGAEVDAAAELALLEPADAELISDRLASAQIFAPSRPLQFFHPLIATALHDHLSPGERRVAHRRAAEILDRDGQRAQVAAHLLATGPTHDPWVTERLCRAAADATDRGAPDSAATYLRRALAEPPVDEQRAEVLLMLGRAEYRAGAPEAISRLEQALALSIDRKARLAAATSLALAYVASDRTTQALAVLEHALDELDDREGRTALELRGRMIAVSNINMAAAGSSVQQAEDVLGRLPEITDPPVQLLCALANYAAQTNRPDQAEALAQRALACEPYPPPLDHCSTLLAALVKLERYDLLARLCEDLRDQARRRGSREELAVIASMRAWGLYDTGALVDAEAEARWAAARASGVIRWTALHALLLVLIERDGIEEAEGLLADLGDPPATTAVPFLGFQAARGRLRAAQGRIEEGLADLLACGQHAQRIGVIGGDRNWRSHAALAHQALGNTEQARSLATEDVALAREFGRPRAIGIALHAHGMVSTGDRRLSSLSESVDVLQRCPARLELARAKADYGAALRRAGERIRARELLERALDLAHHCGARRTAAAARAELIMLGAKPRRDAFTGRDALTPSELRVARLAAQGLANSEIAQALFITRKTASVHLTRVYRKLGITHRRQLAHAIAETHAREGTTP